MHTLKRLVEGDRTQTRSRNMVVLKLASTVVDDDKV
jgi:hypothetical protein